MLTSPISEDTRGEAVRNNIHRVGKASDAYNIARKDVASVSAKHRPFYEAWAGKLASSDDVGRWLDKDYQPAVRAS